MPIRDLLDAHKAAYSLLRPVAVREDSGARSLTALIEAAPARAVSTSGPTRRTSDGEARRRRPHTTTSAERDWPETRPDEGAAPSKRRRKRGSRSQMGQSASQQLAPVVPPSLSSSPPPPEPVEDWRSTRGHVHRFQSMLIAKGGKGASRRPPLGVCLFPSLFAVCRRFSLQPSCHPAVFLLSSFSLPSILPLSLRSPLPRSAAPLSQPVCFPYSHFLSSFSGLCSISR